MPKDRFNKHYIPICHVRLIRDGSITADRNIIRGPEDAYTILKGYFVDLPNEHFLAMLLNTKNHVIAVTPVSTGSLNASIVHPRELFQRAILSNSASVILAHNHPSGDPSPSPEDLELTQALAAAGKVLDIAVIDHIILGDGYWVSLKERGIL